MFVFAQIELSENVQEWQGGKEGMLYFQAVGLFLFKMDLKKLSKHLQFDPTGVQTHDFTIVHFLPLMFQHTELSGTNLEIKDMKGSIFP